MLIDPLDPFGEEEIRKFGIPDVIVTPSTGTNHIDREACKRYGVEVRCLLDDRESLNGITASSEFTFLLLLAALRNLGRALNETKAGRWYENRHILRGRELSKKEVGLIGFGRIGQNMKRYCEVFGADVYYYDPYVLPGAPGNLEAIFANCDAVVICCSLTDEAEGMIDGKLVETMKEGAILVNTARGEILDEESVAEVLNRRPDITFAADVLAGEPEGDHLNSPLYTRADILTPHIAGCTVESEAKARKIAEKLDA